nr:type VI secretion system contractile sheath small subunit [Burkholderia vietnamiensis]
MVGGWADLSGNTVESRGSAEGCRFVQIDTENFDQRMAQIAPSLSYHVKSVLTHEGTLVPVNPRFTSIEPFESTEVVKRLPALTTLLEVGHRLKELLMFMDGKAAAEDLICEPPAWQWVEKPRSFGVWQQ